jgi:RNA polymerase sigma factor (sigma-70 family)
VVFNRADTGGNSMMNFLADFRARRVFNGETTNAMTDSQKLLLEYATESSERAFRELVERYVNLVYSTALRLVEGDAHRAEDVTQMVFADLARKARTRWLPPDLMLGGWLHRNTCFVAAKVMRGERRRQSRERRAVEMNALTEAPTNMTELAPVLDEAINCLRSKDRAAIVLRFFEQQDLRGIGETLGMSENAAQKRVRRALDQLRILLKARGVALSATALATLLTAEAITAAPASLAAVVTGSAVAATAGSVSGAVLLKAIIMTKLKTGIVGAIAVAGITATVLIQTQAHARLQSGEERLRQQSDLLDSLRADRANLAASFPTPARNSANNLEELNRLRAEVASLRQRTNELALLRAAASGSPQRASKPKTLLQDQEDFNEQAISKMNSSRAWLIAFHVWAEQNNGQFPTSFAQALPLLDESAKTDPALNDFDIIYHGSLDSLSTNASKIIVLREKQSWFAFGKWARAYAFADGHSEIHSSADNNFDQWEKLHMIETGADQ